MKHTVPHLLLAIDFGASATKAIGSLVGKPDCITLSMPPITVVMVGFRNTSIFTANYGSVNGSQTSSLGFHDLLKDIAGKTGYKGELKAIVIDKVVLSEDLSIRIQKEGLTFSQIVADPDSNQRLVYRLKTWLENSFTTLKTTGYF